MPKLLYLDDNGVSVLKTLIGQPTDEQVTTSVYAWLDNHPEATTTVQDNSLTDAKLVQTGGILSAVFTDYPIVPTVDQSNACLTQSGYTGTNNGYETSKAVEIPPYTKHIRAGFSFEPPSNNRVGFAFYRTLFAEPSALVGYISGAFANGTVLDIPEGASFVRCSYNTASETPSFSFTHDKIQDIADALDLTHAPGTNLIDKTQLISGYLINGNATKQGALQGSGSSYATPFIRLEEGVNYYINAYRGYYAFYDENKAYVSGDDGTASGFLTSPFTVPEGVKYGRFSIISGQVSVDDTWLSTENERPAPTGYLANVYSKGVIAENPCDYDGMDICAFSSCICIGDSLTYGGYNSTTNQTVDFKAAASLSHSYPSKLAKMTGMEVTNAGESGDSTAQWWANHQDDDLSGYEMAIIQLGVNDHVSGATEWPQAAQTAMTSIIEKLQQENENIKIFVATIIPATSYSGLGYISQGIRSLVESLADENVILVDIAQHGHTADRPDYNCGHLSAYGYWRLARDYANYISYIMANDSSDVFREVQFIGTNYVSGYSS